MADPITLSARADSCQNFAHPKAVVKIGGSPLNGAYRPNDFQIALSASFQAGFCRFKLEKAFVFTDDCTAIALDAALQNNIALGKKVEIQLGYGDAAATTVFVGYIDAVYTDYDARFGVSLTLECLDAKGVMMNSVHSEQKVGLKKYSAAIEDVLNAYTSLIAETAIDGDDDDIETPIEQHNESDYDFIVRLARKLNCLFYLQGGKAVLAKRTGLSSAAAVSYKIGEYVEAFKMQLSLKNKVSSVTVRANDEKDPAQAVAGSASSYQKLTEDGSAQTSAFSSILPQRAARVVIDPTVTSNAQAQARAEAILYELYADLMTGSILTPGIPDVFPGQTVSVDGFGSPYDKKYFVRRVTHTLKDDVFTTRCDLEANHL